MRALPQANSGKGGSLDGIAMVGITTMVIRMVPDQNEASSTMDLEPNWNEASPRKTLEFTAAPVTYEYGLASAICRVRDVTAKDVNPLMGALPALFWRGLPLKGIAERLNKFEPSKFMEGEPMVIYLGPLLLRRGATSAWLESFCQRMWKGKQIDQEDGRLYRYKSGSVKDYPLTRAEEKNWLALLNLYLIVHFGALSTHQVNPRKDLITVITNFPECLDDPHAALTRKKKVGRGKPRDTHIFYRHLKEWVRRQIKDSAKVSFGDLKREQFKVAADWALDGPNQLALMALDPADSSQGPVAAGSCFSSSPPRSSESQAASFVNKD